MAHPNQHRPASDDLDEEVIDLQERRPLAAAERYIAREIAAGERYIEAAERHIARTIDFAGAIASVPPEHRRWLDSLHEQCLQRLVQDEAFRATGEPSPGFVATEYGGKPGFPPFLFLMSFVRNGLVAVVVENINRDDPRTNYKDRRRGWLYERHNLLRDVLPNTAAWAPFLIAGMGRDQPCFVRGMSAKWLPIYLPAVDAVPLLQGVLAEQPIADEDHGRVSSVRLWAAIHLTSLAPDTPGVAEVLGRALTSSPSILGWYDHKWGCDSDDLLIDFGRVEVAEALWRLRFDAFESLPAGACSGLLSGSTHTDEQVRAWALGGIPKLRAVTFETALHLEWDYFLQLLGRIRTGATVLIGSPDKRETRLAELLTEVAARAEGDPERVLVEQWSVEVLAGLPSVTFETILELARRFESATNPLHRLFARIRDGETTFSSCSPEESFLLAVLMDREDDTVRLVYADWLDEQEQPDKAAYVRTEVEFRRAPATVTDWADVHRTGWAEFRRTGSEWIWERVTGTRFDTPPSRLFHSE